MENKQTAINWLVDQIRNPQNQKALTGKEWMEVIERAKQMEKEQIINAANQNQFEDVDGMGICDTITKGEQYYKETYGQ